MDNRFVNRTVLHKQYGKGIIISTHSTDISVMFANQTMDFHFPDVFQRGNLATNDTDLRIYVQRSLTNKIPSRPQDKKQRFGASMKDMMQLKKEVCSRYGPCDGKVYKDNMCWDHYQYEHYTSK